MLPLQYLPQPLHILQQVLVGVNTTEAIAERLVSEGAVEGKRQQLAAYGVDASQAKARAHMSQEGEWHGQEKAKECAMAAAAVWGAGAGQATWEELDACHSPWTMRRHKTYALASASS